MATESSNLALQETTKTSQTTTSLISASNHQQIGTLTKMVSSTKTLLLLRPVVVPQNPIILVVGAPQQVKI